MSLSVKRVLLGIALMAILGQSLDLKSYNIDLSDTRVSGVSAGGYMAGQFHFAHSEHVQGAAIFAGGPYLCAMGTVQAATTACMVAPWVINNAWLELNIDYLNDHGYIDSLDNLQGDLVYVYSGTHDWTVFTGAVEKNAEMYLHYGAEVKAEYSIPSGHCYPTESFGTACPKTHSPFLNACGYNGAKASLDVIYGAGLKPATPQLQENLFSFSQQDYVNGKNHLSMGDTGYVYVPTACQKGEACRLLISFHGCAQTIADVGLDYVTKTGQNEIAEANNLIVLYPQVKRSLLAPTNPEGCFDWWGYTTELIPFFPTTTGYASKIGPQIEAVWNMALQLAGQGGEAKEFVF